jgi:hypothetical protein
MADNIGYVKLWAAAQHRPDLVLWDFPLHLNIINKIQRGVKISWPPAMIDTEHRNASIFHFYPDVWEPWAVRKPLDTLIFCPKLFP